LEPPKRGKTMPWKTFLQAHFGVIAATDFFTIEVLTLGGIVHYVWFVIDLESRRVHIAGMRSDPHDAWTQQVARNLRRGVDRHSDRPTRRRAVRQCAEPSVKSRQVRGRSS
jgi:putative transposase